ncbi:neprilysin-2-like isoform X2 [Dermacentor albipictus]|uniref:neprilysin-2-like isoform X2 n=1 Tax=Dermacentor albipictus TaxID=60249 RepID=UPI0038FD33A9
MRNHQVPLAQAHRRPMSERRFLWQDLFSLPVLGPVSVILLIVLVVMCTQLRFRADAGAASAKKHGEAGLQPEENPNFLITVTPTHSDECESQVCLWNRDYLFRFGYSTSHPCEDFYEHVCDAFLYKRAGFGQQPYPLLSTGQLLLDLDMFFKRFLAIKGRYPRPIESNFLVQAMWVHEKCKAAHVTGDTLSAWTKVLDSLDLSGWPYGKFSGDLVKLVSTGDRYLMLETLFRVNVLRTVGGQTLSQIVLKAPVTYLRRYISLSRPNATKRYLETIVQALSLYRNVSMGEMVGKQMSRLEIALENLTSEDTMPAEYAVKDLWSIDMLPKSDNWDWLRYMRLLFKTETRVIGTTFMFVEDPSFFSRVHTVFDMGDYETAIANYVGFKAMVTFSPFMPSDYRLLYEFSHGYDTSRIDAQLAACSFLLEKMYRYGVGVAAKLTSSKEFASVYRTYNDDQFAALFNETRTTVRDLLQSGRSWFSRDDLKGAQRKLDAMTLVFGTQANFVQYEGYRQTPALALESKSSVLDTVFAIFSYASSIYWDALVSSGTVRTGAAYDNAYATSIFDWGSEYQATNNLVFVPNGVVGFLSTVSNKIPFQLYPVVLAHVVRAALRALVRSNSLFDGRMVPRKWWSAQTVGAYENLTQCLRRRYEAAAPGRLSTARLENDFLDNAVLRPLYELYEKSLEKHNATRMYYQLPELRVTSKELFFYNYASAFCDGADKATRKLQRSLAITPAKWRVNVPLGNFAPFLRTFSCPTKRDQLPRCEVWQGFD